MVGRVTGGGGGPREKDGGCHRSAGGCRRWMCEEGGHTRGATVGLATGVTIGRAIVINGQWSMGALGTKWGCGWSHDVRQQPLGGEGRQCTLRQGGGGGCSSHDWCSRTEGDIGYRAEQDLEDL